MLNHLYFHSRFRIYQMSLGHAFKFFWDLGMRSYVFILKIKLETEHFRIGFGKGEFLSHK